MKEMFNEILQYRYLLYTLTWRNIKIRYKQSAMGFLWAIFMPMLIVAAGILVKKAFSILSEKPLQMEDIVSVMVKSLPWSFFVASIKFSMNSLVGNSNLVTKIYFPREIFPIAATLANIFDFFIASIALIVIFGIAGIAISIQVLWIPLLVLILVILTIGLGLFFSCANLFFRDVKYLVDVLLTFGIFFTPVFYDASMFGKWKYALLLNPVGAILENINTVVVYHKPPDIILLSYSITISLFIFIMAWKFFHKLEFVFAEYI
jgi:ABC-type polysaccharide/polyol phosphate export permease